MLFACRMLRRVRSRSRAINGSACSRLRRVNVTLETARALRLLRVESFAECSAACSKPVACLAGPGKRSLLGLATAELLAMHAFRQLSQAFAIASPLPHRGCSSR